MHTGGQNRCLLRWQSLELCAYQWFFVSRLAVYEGILLPGYSHGDKRSCAQGGEKLFLSCACKFGKADDAQVFTFRFLALSGYEVRREEGQATVSVSAILPALQHF